MILNKIYAILGSLLFLDLIVLVDVIFNLSIFIFGAGSVLGIVKILTNLMILILGLIWVFTKDDKWSRYMRYENGKSWIIAKNMLLTSILLRVLFIGNPMLFMVLQIVSIICGIYFIVIQAWYIKTGRWT